MATTNEAMVQDLEDSGTLISLECIAAFKNIDRQHFWVPESAEFVYADMPLRHGRLHQSAPHIYAKALESMMPLKPGMSFLNVGAGTGYFSSIVSELCGPDAISDGVDIWQETVEHSRNCCQKIGKGQIRFTLGNVYQLDVEQGMRYDRIYVGACANSRSKYLYRLLEVGGILIGPFQAGHMQQLRKVVRRTEVHFAVEVLNTVQFATLVEPLPEISTDDTAEDVRGFGLKGVAFTFALRERPWALERNLAYPPAYKTVVRAMISGRSGRQGFPTLPPEIWSNHILPYCARAWFEVSEKKLMAPLPSPSKVRIVLGLVGEAMKNGVFRRRFSGDSLGDGDGDSDGGSTRASSAAGSPVRASRSGSELSFGPASSQSSSSEITLYEALGDGSTYAIGSSNDPDDTPDHRAGLTLRLLESRLNTEAENELVEETPQIRMWNLAAASVIQQSIEWCRCVVPHGCLGGCRHIWPGGRERQQLRA
jgi:protein-L-isoaspartate(D-aspartate) O-methyltransferase